MKEKLIMSTCYTCGYSWPTGTDGSHYCAVVMGEKINDLEAEIEKLKKDFLEEHLRAEQKILEKMKLWQSISEERSDTLHLLRKLEWHDDGFGLLVCPCCGKAKGTGHMRICELAAAIKKGTEQ